VTETIASILKYKGDTTWSIGPDSTVYEALAMMAQHSIGALLVLEDGRLRGIISERDYARKVILHGKSSKDTPVREIMTTSPVTVTPENTIDECMVIMTRDRVRHLPVMVGDRIAGIVSIGDLVNAIISDQAETINHLHTYITGTPQ
jgi:CBS domain-containing protein